MRATIDYSRVLEDQAFFIPGEYALEALTGRWAIHYIEETRAGGHLSYGLATHWDDLKVRAAMAGLRSMGADPYMALLKEMKHLVDDPKRGKKYRAGYGAVLKGIARFNTNDFWALLEYENALPWESSAWSAGCSSSPGGSTPTEHLSPVPPAP